MKYLSDALHDADFQGDIDITAATRESYSHDASLFEIVPDMVVSPVDAKDVEKLVAVIAKLKRTYPALSLTGRSAGTDMAGGAINDSVIASFTPHMNHIGKVTATTATAQPGVYYRDFEVETLKHDGLMPT
jgi:FAD/FMN-containing dehydrogenase